MSLQMKPSEEKKDSSPPPSPTSSCLLFSLLPEELIINCLAWIPRWYYPRLSTVCKSFKSLLSSTELYLARSHLGSTEECLYVCLQDYKCPFSEWSTLSINPNQTLPNSSVTKKKKKKNLGHLFVPIRSCNFLPQQSETILVVGSEIYVVGGIRDKVLISTVWVLDCRSLTWREAPRMNVARRFAGACVYGGKIYVMGGCELLGDDEPWAEVFDLKTQTWECLPDPKNEIRKIRFPSVEEIEGKIYAEYNNNLYAYDTTQGKWGYFEKESTRFIFSDCVMENVPYELGVRGIRWYDIKVQVWKMVKGLDRLVEKPMYMRNGSCSSEMVSCGGKLVLIWGELMEHDKKIWYAGIIVEKSDDGELWGKIKFVNVKHRVPKSCILRHCLAVSV